jgi:hypothetical protein
VSAAERPWWATAADAAGDLDDDPLETHRAARRGPDQPPPDETSTPPGGGGAAATDGPDDDGSWWVPATEAVTRLARDLTASATASPPRGLVDDEPPGRAAAGPADTGPGAADRPRGAGGGPGDGEGHRIDACGVCPICVGLRVLGDARPDLVGHLAEAARQLALAVRTVVDAAAPEDEAADPSAPRRGAGRKRPPEDLQRIDLDD